MSVIKLSVRPLSDLIYTSAGPIEFSPEKSTEHNSANEEATTKKKSKQVKTTSKVKNLPKHPTNTSPTALEQPSTHKKSRTSKKELLPGQKTIDKFFKSAGKNFKIEPAKEMNNKLSKTQKLKKTKSRRKIFSDSETSVSSEDKFRKRKIKNKKPSAYIDLCLLDSDKDEASNENVIQINQCPGNSKDSRTCTSTKDADMAKQTDSGNPDEIESFSEEFIPPSPENPNVSTNKKKSVNISWSEQRQCLIESNRSEKSKKPSKIFPSTPKTNQKVQNLNREQKICSTTEIQSNNEPQTLPSLVAIKAEENVINISDDDFEPESNIQNKTITKNVINTRKTKSKTKTNEPNAKKAKRPPRPLPPYKIVEGTNFAVDAFCYGEILGVEHYFLTHFHSDHYIGLNQKFSNKIYMSSITARLVRTFIKIDEQYINELELNIPIKVDDVEIIAIDANHCPGAVMFVFKTSDGRCTLHTGDFRASSDMESEPIFWNNDINTIYLDTTYISSRYSFCAQSESMDRAIKLIEEFNEKNAGSRKLFVCGTYLIGKEKFWSALARHFSYKVWAETNRRKALKALDCEEFNQLLTNNPLDAQMHLVDMGKLRYDTLVKYLEQYEEHFDLVVGLRPSGWEKNSKPQYRGKVNIMGIEYSEHSSRDEMKRFVQYLKPQNVISTVPMNSKLFTPRIPQIWYKYKNLKRTYEPSITSFFKLKPKNNIQLDDIANTPEQSKSISKHNELMMISPDVAEPNEDENLNRNVEDSETTKFQLKKEIPAKVPIVQNPIYIDDCSDDDWLT